MYTYMNKFFNVSVSLFWNLLINDLHVAPLMYIIYPLSLYVALYDLSITGQGQLRPGQFEFALDPRAQEKHYSHLPLPRAVRERPSTAYTGRDKKN